MSGIGEQWERQRVGWRFGGRILGQTEGQRGEKEPWLGPDGLDVGPRLEEEA